MIGAVVVALAILACAWAGPGTLSIVHATGTVAASEPAPADTPVLEGHPRQGPAMLDARDYPNLHAAFAAVSQRGGLLVIPPGDYPIEEPLVVNGSNVRIVGAGPATRIINHNQEGKPTIHIRADDYSKNRGARLWRVELANLRLQGDPEAVDGKTTQPTSGPGVLAEGVNEIFFHGLSVDHHGGHGIALIDCYEDPRICDCIITYNRKAGIYLHACHDIVVNANQLEENQQALVCVDGYNLCMNGNNLDDHLGEGVVVENTYGSVISGNMIEECQSPAIVLDRDCYGITVSANVIAHNFGGGVDLRDAWGCAVSGNTFTINPTFGLRIGPNSGRITVTGNNFSDSYIGDKTLRTERDNAATGIVLEGTRNIVISGNQFSGVLQSAITARHGCRRLAITGNIVLDVGRSQPAETPSIDLGDATDTILDKNIVSQDN